MKKKRLKKKLSNTLADLEMLANMYDSLSEENQNLAEELEDVKEQCSEAENDYNALRKKILGVFCFLVIMLSLVAICWFFFKLISSSQSKCPSGKKLEDNFISAGSEYDDGTYFFNFEGYLKENGFKHFEVSYNDDTYHPRVTITAYNKYWELDLCTRIETDLYDGVSSIEFSHYVKSLGLRSKDYTVTYGEEVQYASQDDQSSRNSDYLDDDPYYYWLEHTDKEYGEDTDDYSAKDIDNHLVRDVNSGFFIPYSLLLDLDKVLKAQDTYDGKPNIASRYRTDHCPFEGLGIEHYSETGFTGGESPHDD